MIKSFTYSFIFIDGPLNWSTHFFFFCTKGRDRTYDQLHVKQPLLPLSYLSVWAYSKIRTYDNPLTRRELWPSELYRLNIYDNPSIISMNDNCFSITFHAAHTRVELATSGVTGQHVSYNTSTLYILTLTRFRSLDIPPYTGGALPLYYQGIWFLYQSLFLVARAGLEPATCDLWGHRATNCSTAQCWASDENRTRRACAPAWKAGVSPLRLHSQKMCLFEFQNFTSDNRH